MVSSIRVSEVGEFLPGRTVHGVVPGTEKRMAAATDPEVRETFEGLAILRFARDIPKAYAQAPDELKKRYLSFFFTHFPSLGYFLFRPSRSFRRAFSPSQNGMRYAKSARLQMRRYRPPLPR